MLVPSELKGLSSEYLSKKLLHISALIIYCAINTALYFYSNNIIESRKSEILNTYYKIVLNNTIVKLEPLIQKASLNRGTPFVINIENTNINGCYNKQCSKVSLLELASALDDYVAKLINYKIEINKQLVHCNNKIPSYDLERIEHINNNQISISISLDPSYLAIIRDQIRSPFNIVIVCITILFILFIWATKITNKLAQQFYSNKYKNFYDLKIKAVQEDYQLKLLDKENLLMKKIWSLEYSQERDIELNHLFALEINKLAITQRADNTESDEKVEKFLPCSLILYLLENKEEQIRIKDLIETFSKRFVNSEDNISYDFASDDGNINFVSKASLYQIIYSILTYISFILKSQLSNLKYNIKLEIMHEEDGICLLFKFDGIPIAKENELFGHSIEFFKKHVNPFLLSIDQIFFVLREDNYECTIGYDDTNFIQITKKRASKILRQSENNVISLLKIKKNEL